MFFKPEQMYGEDRKVFENLPHIVNGNIYFLTERRKIRIDPDKSSLGASGDLDIEFVLEGGQKNKAKIPIAPLFIDLGNIREVYENEDNLQNRIVVVPENVSSEELLNRAKKSNNVVISLSTNKQPKKYISFDLYTPAGQTVDMHFSIHSILSKFEIDIGDYPKLLYIGKSGKLQNRIYKHEKIQQALSQVDDESDIYLYAFQFDDQYLTRVGLPDNKVIWERNVVNDISEEDKISLVEMTLINYFKPLLNSDFKNCDITKNETFVKALQDRYTQLILEVDHDGGFWNFGSDHIQPALRHEIQFPVST